MESDSERLERYLENIGWMEGAPERVIDQAKCYGRTLLFHVKPAMRVSPAEAFCKAADYLRRRTNRVD